MFSQSREDGFLMNSVGNCGLATWKNTKLEPQEVKFVFVFFRYYKA